MIFPGSYWHDYWYINTDGKQETLCSCFIAVSFSSSARTRHCYRVISGTARWAGVASAFNRRLSLYSGGATTACAWSNDLAGRSTALAQALAPPYLALRIALLGNSVNRK